MKKITLVMFILILVSQVGIGQIKTFKEVKAINFEETYKKGERIIILGERTFVTLKSWDKGIVSINAEIVSRYKDQSIAKSDLEKIDLNFSKNRKKITYSNAIRIGSPKDKPVANLKVYLEIYVPEGAIVEIENHFGEINIDASLSKLTIESDFTKISINDSEGDSNITTKYGDTSIDGIKADVNLIADRSNLMLKNIQGNLDIDVKYGEVDLYPSDNTIFSEFKAQYSPIEITLPSEYTKSLDVVCNGCEINYNKSFSSIFDESENHVVINKGATSNGRINSEIENIQIK